MIFSDLQTSVEGWIVDLPSGMSASVPGWINFAIREAEERHNFKAMEAILDSQKTTELTQLLVAKPALWKEARGNPWYVNQDGSVKPMNWAADWNQMARTYSIDLPAESNTTTPDQGPPRWLLETESDLLVFPYPDLLSLWNDGNYRVTVPYWAYLTDLAASGDSNWFTTDTNALQYVTFRAAALGAAQNEDYEKETMLNKRAERQYKIIEWRDKRKRLPTRMSLAVHKDVYAEVSRSNQRG